MADEIRAVLAEVARLDRALLDGIECRARNREARWTLTT